MRYSVGDPANMSYKFEAESDEAAIKHIEDKYGDYVDHLSMSRHAETLTKAMVEAANARGRRHLLAEEYGMPKSDNFDEDMRYIVLDSASVDLTPIGPMLDRASYHRVWLVFNNYDYFKALRELQEAGTIVEELSDSPNELYLYRKVADERKN